jgi:hypothetical protein
MSNSDIQQGLAQMIEALQRRNQAENEYINALSTAQQRLSEVLRQNTELNDSLEEQRNIREEINESEERSVENTESSNRALTQQQGLFAKLKSNSIAVGALTGAFSGLATGISTVFRIGKIAFQSFIDVIGKVTSTVFSLAKSIFMLPFNMFKSFVSMAASGSGSTELLDAIENIRKEWGSFKNETASSVLQISSLGVSLKNLAVANAQFWSTSLAPGRSLARVWQSLAGMLKDMSELLSAMGPSINLVMNQFKESVEVTRSIIAMQKGLGLTKEEFAALGKVSAISGKKIIDIEYEMGNLSLQLGDKFGLSSKKISSDVGKMMKDFEHFGNLSTKQLNSVAAYTQRLGLETTKLLGLMDKFDQFEDAADASSKLSQAFGLQVDSMEMMRSQDPAERFDMIRAAMVRAGISSDGMRNQTVKLFTSLTGLDAETVRIGLNTKNLGKTYDEVKNETENAAAKQLDQTEVLTRLADAIEKVNRSGQGMKDGFLKTFLDGIQKGVERTPSFMNMMQNLRGGLRETWRAGMGTGQSIFSMLGITDEFDMKTGKMTKQGIFGKIGESFGAESMAKFWGGFELSKDKFGNVVKKKIQGLPNVSDFLKEIFSSKENEKPEDAKKRIDKAFDDLIKLIQDKFGELTNPNSSIYASLGKLGDILGRVFQRIFTSAGSKIGEIFKKGAVLLKSGDMTKNVQDELQKVEDSPWMKFIMPVWEGIKSAFLSAFDGFAEFAPELLKKIISGLTWIFKGVQYFLSDDKTRKELDKGMEGSFLKMSPSKSGTKQDSFSEKFNESFNKLSDGITGVFKNPDIMDPFKKAFDGAWEQLKKILIEGIKDGLTMAWNYLAPYIAAFLAKQMMFGTVKGAVQGALTGPAVNAAAKGAEGLGVAAKGAEELGAAAKGAEVAANVAKAGKAAGILSKAGSFLGPILKKAGPLAILAGGLTGLAESDEKEGLLGKSENVLQGVLTGGTKSGSVLSTFGILEKGGFMDKVAGVAGAALQGATVAGTTGAAIGALGGPTAIFTGLAGAIGGGVVGAGTELYKIWRDSKTKQENISSNAGEIAQNGEIESVPLPSSVQQATSPQQNVSQQATSTAPSQTTSTSPQQQTSEKLMSVVTPDDLKKAKDLADKASAAVEANGQLIKATETNIVRIAESASKISIDIQKVTVDLKKFEDRLMQGVANIKEVKKAVMVNVDVAVQLDVKELEEIIVKRKESKIRKAVSVIEKNLSDLKNGPVTLEEKEGADQGALAKGTLG